MPAPVDIGVYQRRRARLAAAMGTGVAFVPTAAERARNRDAHYPYRFDSYFYYLTGFREPEAVVVVIAGDTSKSILFCREKDSEREVWDGFRHGPDAARAVFDFDEAYPIGRLDELVPQLLRNQPALYCHLGSDPHWDARAIRWLNDVRGQVRSGATAPRTID